MPDADRPNPTRRTNQGALVVILAAMMLVNLTTLGLLWHLGVFSGDDTPTPGPSHAHNDTSADPRPATPPVNDTALRPPAPQLDTAHATHNMPTPPDVHEAPAPRPVAADTPAPAPPATTARPARPPMEFFGMPLFE